MHVCIYWSDFTMVTVYPDLLSGKPDQYRNSLLGQLQLTQLLPFNTTGKPCLGSLHKSRVCIHGWDATTQCWPACEISAASAGWVGGMLLDTAGYIKQHSPYPTSTGRHLLCVLDVAALTGLRILPLHPPALEGSMQSDQTCQS